MDTPRRLGAEFFGTFWLTFAGCGRGMSGSPPITSKPQHRSEMTRGAINGLMQCSK
jgi:glycerol uptake facilitator-like aquaporin